MGEGEVHESKTVSVSISVAVSSVEKVFPQLAILTLTWFLCSNNNTQTTMGLSYNKHDDYYVVRC